MVLKIFMQGVAAHKWCKELQDTENRVLSVLRPALFHKLINTCVENFTRLKYFSRDSASLVLTEKFLNVYSSQ